LRLCDETTRPEKKNPGDELLQGKIPSFFKEITTAIKDYSHFAL